LALLDRWEDAEERLWEEVFADTAMGLTPIRENE